MRIQRGASEANVHGTQRAYERHKASYTHRHYQIN